MGICKSCIGTDDVALGEVPTIKEQDLIENRSFVNGATNRFSEFEMTMPVWRTDLTFFYSNLIKAELKDAEGKGTEKTSIERLKTIF